MVWGAICLGMAAVFFFFWPSARVGPNTGALQFLLLRWGHSAVWLLLALAIFLRTSVGAPGEFVHDTLPSIAGVLAVVVYIAFLAALLRR